MINDGEPILPRTRILVNEWLLTDLANIVLQYFQSPVRDWNCISIAGEYETCLHVRNMFQLNIAAICRNGYIEILKFMMFWGVIDWNTALQGACEGDQLEIAKLLISRSSRDRGHSCDCPIHWPLAIQCAVRFGNTELADYLNAHPLNHHARRFC